MHRIAAAYSVAAWLIVQVVETVFPAFGFDDSTTRLTVIILIIGFVPAVVLAWVFELTPEGIRRERPAATGSQADPIARRRLDRAIMVVLAVAVAYFAIDKFLTVETRGPSSPATNDSTTYEVTDTVAARSIAVLPFADMSPASDHEFFADGIAEELLNLLSRVPELRVVSRSSSFAFKQKDMTATEIAGALGVNYILEGSVRKDADQVRITTQLIDARADTHLWSNTYEGSLRDVFAIQDDIAASVIPALEIELLGALPTTTETDPEAYTLFLQGVHFYLQRTSEGLDLAVDHLQRSLAIDDSYAPAYISLASAYMNQASTGQRVFREAFELATKAVDTALQIDPMNPYAHSARAWIAFNYDRDYPKSAQHFRVARSLYPNSSVILANASTLAAHLGQLEESIRLVSRSIELDPTSSVAFGMRAQRLARIGRLEKAENDLKMAMQLSAGSSYYHGVRAQLRLLQDRPGDALVDAKRMDNEPLRLAVIAMAQFDLGQLDQSDAAIKVLHSGYADASPYNIALAHAWRHETDLAIEWLNRAIDGGHSIFGIKTDPMLAVLHDDPRWQPLLESLDLGDAQVADIQL